MIVYVTPFRRRARAVERDLQAALDRGEHPAAVPGWAGGVRVEKAGLFSWAVVATPGRGR